MGIKTPFNPGPNRAQRRGSRMTQVHMSKSGTRGRAKWNWQKGAFGQPIWRRPPKEEVPVVEAV